VCPQGGEQADAAGVQEEDGRAVGYWRKEVSGGQWVIGGRRFREGSWLLAEGGFGSGGVESGSCNCEVALA